MKHKILLLLIPFTLIACSKDDPHSAKSSSEYARLTMIEGNGDQFGTRYFWESRTEKTETMNFKQLHEHFNVSLPKEGELKVTPFDYNVIDSITNSGWQLVGVSSAASYKEDFKEHKDLTMRNAGKVYHFTK